MGQVTGRIALVTGASRSFGRAVALLFAQEGADVVVNYRAAEAEAQTVADEIERIGRRALVVQADVAEAKQIAVMVERALAAFGRIDILVNNAGVIEYIPFLEQDPANWKRIIDVNVYGPLHVTRQVLPKMVEQQYGRIVNVASMAAHTGGGGSNTAVYSGTKGFLLAFTKSVASEYGPYGITANAVCPGSIPSDMNVQLFTPEFKTRRSAEVPVRRLGEAIDVARAALYLASDDAGFVTGQCIDVNGGTLMV